MKLQLSTALAKDLPIVKTNGSDFEFASIINFRIAELHFLYCCCCRAIGQCLMHGNIKGKARGRNILLSHSKLVVRILRFRFPIPPEIRNIE